MEEAAGRRRPACRHCGLPVRVVRLEPVYCCSGCAWADRLSDGGAEAPALGPAPVVVAGVVAVFGLMNQGLGWLLSVLLGREGRVDGAMLAGVGAQLAGGLAVAALAYAQKRSGASDWRDVGWVCGAAAAQLWVGVSGASPGWAWVATLALASWSVRGLVRSRAKNAGGR